MTAPTLIELDAAASPTGPGGDVAMFTLVHRWQSFLEASGRASPTTRRQYRRSLVAFLADVLTDLRLLTEDDLVAWIASQPPQGGMRNQTLRALKSFYRFAVDHELLATDPTRRLRITKDRARPARALSTEDLERLLVAAERVDPRARWAMQLAYATGARVSSLCGIRAADVRPDLSWIDFRVAKNDDPYGVPLGPKGREAVKHLLELADYTPRTVATRRPTLVGVGTGRVWQWVKAAAEIAGLEAWPHLLRSTFATRLVENGVDPRTWQELMSHRDLTQYRRYVAPSDPRMREAVESL